MRRLAELDAEWRDAVEGMTFFGEPVKDLDKDSLLRLIGYLITGTRLIPCGGMTVSAEEDRRREIDRLRSLTRFQDGVIRSGDVACLTGAERTAIEHAISRELDAEHYGGDEPTRVVVLRCLLDRLGGER